MVMYGERRLEANYSDKGTVAQWNVYGYSRMMGGIMSRSGEVGMGVMGLGVEAQGRAERGLGGGRGAELW